MKRKVRLFGNMMRREGNLENLILEGKNERTKEARKATDILSK